VDDFSESVSEAELREFLEADALGSQADPLFKARLRDRLWELVRAALPRSPGVPAPRPTDGRAAKPARKRPPSSD